MPKEPPQVVESSDTYAFYTWTVFRSTEPQLSVKLHDPRIVFYHTTAKVSAGLVVSQDKPKIDVAGDAHCFDVSVQKVSMKKS